MPRDRWSLFSCFICLVSFSHPLSVTVLSHCQTYDATFPRECTVVSLVVCKHVVIKLVWCIKSLLRGSLFLLLWLLFVFLFVPFTAPKQSLHINPFLHSIFVLTASVNLSVAQHGEHRFHLFSSLDWDLDSWFYCFSLFVPQLCPVVRSTLPPRDGLLDWCVPSLSSSWSFS